MVLFGNRKYACLSCIRGHRSSSCEHKDRILLQVRKPGRKSQAEPQGRYALIAKEPSPALKPTKDIDYKLVKVPDVNDERHVKLAEPAVHEDEDVVVTEKYVFVHVADNLFRRELRPGYTSAARSSSATSVASSNIKLPSTNGSPYFASTAASSEVPSPPPRAHSPRAPYSRMLMQPGMQAANTANEFHHSPTSSSHIDPLFLESEAPLVIGPMQYQHDVQNRQANILNELGLSAEEANQIWAGDPDSGDFSFATQCVLPGQCQCGDDCECANCYEHQTLRNKVSAQKKIELEQKTT